MAAWNIEVPRSEETRKKISIGMRKTLKEKRETRLKELGLEEEDLKKPSDLRKIEIPKEIEKEFKEEEINQDFLNYLRIEIQATKKKIKQLKKLEKMYESEFK